MHFNIADLFESLADAIPEREALICGQQRYTYGDLEAEANRVAHVLKSQGIGPGDKIGVHMYNCAEFMAIVLGAFKVRACPININYRYVARELEYLFDNADVQVLFTEGKLTPEVARAAPNSPGLKSVVVLRSDDPDQLQGLPAVSKYEDAIAAAPAVRDFEERSPDDLYILFTGGTTGMPKGVMWRHEDVFFAGLQGGNPGGPPIERPEQLAEKAAANRFAMTFMPLAPFIHGAAQWAALIGMFSGGKVVVIGGKFDPEQAWKAAAAEKVNTITLVGDAMARPLVDHFDDSLDLKSVRIIASAGAVLSDTVKDGLKQKLGMVMIMNSFGSSESGHNGHAMPGMDKGVGGRVSFKMDDTAKVYNEETGKFVEPGSGEIGKYVRTGRLPLGYYKDREKTDATFIELEGKRWSMPGDFATVETDGRITLFGRGAVCINSGGQKIFPEEVESALKAHDGIMDCLVVGLPDDKWGQRVAAVIQPREGHTLNFQSVNEHIREHVADFKCPKDVYLCEEVARQPSGKPDYKWALEHAQASTPIH